MFFALRVFSVTGNHTGPVRIFPTKQSGVCSTQRQAKRMGIPSIIIMDLTVHKEKVIELRRESRVLKRKHKKPLLKQMNVVKF